MNIDLYTKLPSDIQHLIFLYYRTKLRKRIAQKKLTKTRKKCNMMELLDFFTFANGNLYIVFFILNNQV